MDGVLVDMVRGLEEEFDQKLHPWPADEYNPASLLGLSTKELWFDGRLSVDFWKNLQPTQWCTELMSIAHDYDFYIMTVPTDSVCVAGKMHWIEHHLPKAWSLKRWMIGPTKHQMATPETILIDDYDLNIKLFREAGGKTITFPAPWNEFRKRCDKPMAHVIAGLEYFHGKM